MQTRFPLSLAPASGLCSRVQRNRKSILGIIKGFSSSLSVASFHKHKEDGHGQLGGILFKVDSVAQQEKSALLWAVERCSPTFSKEGARRISIINSENI